MRGCLMMRNRKPCWTGYTTALVKQGQTYVSHKTVATMSFVGRRLDF